MTKYYKKPLVLIQTCFWKKEKVESSVQSAFWILLYFNYLFHFHREDIDFIQQNEISH